MLRAIAILAIALVVTPAKAGAKDKLLAARIAWNDCVVAKSKEMAGRATLDDVVEAAFGLCADEQRAYEVSLFKASKGLLGMQAPADPAELARQESERRTKIKSAAKAAILMDAAPVIDTPSAQK